MFYSDLDSTLIFSKRYLPTSISISCIDYKDGVSISYIANETNHLLQELIKNKQFVPVTARNLRQYLRISCLPSDEIEWAVISSGEVILHYGKEYLPYSNIIGNLNENLLSIEKVITNYNFTYRKMSKYTYLIEGKNNENMLERTDELTLALQEFEFQVLKTKLDSQNPQLLVSPIKFNKGVAVDFIKNLCKDSNVICSGDSAPDLSMLNIADIGIINKGMYDIFEIVKNNHNILIVPNENFLGSYEIIKKVKTLL